MTVSRFLLGGSRCAYNFTGIKADFKISPMSGREKLVESLALYLRAKVRKIMNIFSFVPINSLYIAWCVFIINFYFVVFQDLEPYEQLEKLKQSKSELLLKIAALKQQIVDIETQENEAIREVGQGHDYLSVD